MTDSYQCLACSRVIPLVHEKDIFKGKGGECPSCGASGRGQIISENRLREGLAAGSIYNIDPKTGDPLKRR